MRIALVFAILVIPLSAPAQEAAASITGAVVDMTGRYLAKAAVELYSGTMIFKIQTDESGVYRFSNLSAGEFTLRFRMPGFKALNLTSIRLSAREQKRIPDVPLDIGTCSPIYRDLVLLPSEDLFGRLSGSVVPAAPGVEISLVCRTFSACRSTRTDSNGHFSFDMISAGVYGLNFHREGYYPENATGYSYYVNAGWESVYSPVSLERCANGNCDAKLRPPPQVQYCE